ncbi:MULTISPECIES: methyl-accepting chemotaxis protein [Rhizobium/Agrobacterium group]|uniref:methyl-accepting chemotaxis protein n=1 Tax=Rhizobium/Agrobacterium group TaxID=227290 RepID=UPI000AF8C108|nr:MULTISPECIES: methyl-accepting chemotaxis protein [Rhizobium/Agrobacterium group]
MQLCQDIRNGVTGRRDAQRTYCVSANLIQLWLTQFDRGDLTFQLVQPFAAEFETLRANFNAALSQFSETMCAVSDAAGAIDNGSREVSASPDDLSTEVAMDQHAAHMEGIEDAGIIDCAVNNLAGRSHLFLIEDIAREASSCNN